MGVAYSCPLGAYCDLDNGFESVLVKSIASLDHVYEEKAIECQDLASEGMAVVEVPQLPVLSPGSPKHLAAVKLQKVYKSFRTRRKLADCAVLVEQSWWKLLDFAELKHSSISFFDTDKHETAISRWSRARTRAAKVGKGLSKNSRAQKLALQHWLEAIDPRHRYGHNLHFYYVKWLHSQSKEPFFYWLDIGEGKEVNIVEKCPRWKLQQQCIKYLGPIERKAYEVTVENGELVYQQTGELVDTASEPKAKWIFVLSATRTMYVGKKRKGTFQHSSFLAGGATLAAGRLVVEKGVLKAVWPHSGHYRPTPENFQDFISFLKENNVDLTDVKLDSGDESEESLGRGNGHVRNNSEEDLSESLAIEVVEAIKVEENAEVAQSIPPLQVFASKLSNLEIPNNDGLLLSLKSKNEAESPSDGYETTEESLLQPENIASSELFDGIKEDESILQRINSHKGNKSFQLGGKLSCKWSTGAGPRIGCLRDYPSELQCHALEEANLSPRSGATLLQRFNSSNLNKSPLLV